MQKFYFNECLPETTDKNTFKDLFCTTLRTLIELTTKYSSIEKAVVTEKLPSSIKIGANIGTLSDIINDIENKDLKNSAFAYFNRYPLDKYFQLNDQKTTEVLEKEYVLCFDNKDYDALNLAIVGINQGFLFTTAVHKDVEKDILSLVSRSDNHSIDIFNLYGERPKLDQDHLELANAKFITEKIIAAELSNQTSFKKLVALLGDCIYSKTFEREFSKLQTAEQFSIIDEFKKAKERNLITPFYPDTKIIKDVTPANNAKCKVYELRVYAPTAIRVYFSETESKVFVTKIGYKASPDQSGDIKTAHLNLYKMISTA